MAQGDGPGRKAQVSDEEILDALSSGMSRLGTPALSTSDVADFVPISRQAVKRRLENLAEEKEVGVHQAGRNRFWWVATEDHRGGELALDSIVEVGDLTDDRLIELFEEQVDPQNIPESFSTRIIQEHLSPDNLENSIVFEKLRKEFDYSDLPEDIASRIAYDVFEYNSKYWAQRVREGVYTLAFGWLVIALAFIFLTVSENPPTFFITTLGQGLVVTILNGLTAFTAVVWMATLVAGGYLILLGASSRLFWNGEKPPWSGILSKLNARLPWMGS